MEKQQEEGKEEKQRRPTPPPDDMKYDICGHCGGTAKEGSLPSIEYCGTYFTIHSACVGNFRDSQ